MKAALSVISGVLATALIAGCSQSGGEDTGTTDESTQPAVTDAESSAPPVRTAAVMPEFSVPAGFTEAAQEGVSFTLDYEHVGVTYQLDGATELERIFVTSYLLPEDIPTETFDDRKVVVALYDEVTGNESASSGTRALASGYPAVFRYLSVAYDDQNAFQRNFFVFDGNVVAQVTCQWKAEESEAAVEQGCR